MSVKQIPYPIEFETFFWSNQIIPGPNDRTVFAGHELDGLAASIAKEGLIENIVIRPLVDRFICPICKEEGATPFQHTHKDVAHVAVQMYEIVAGERRYRAMAEVNHWDRIPGEYIKIMNVDARTASGLMLAENTQRADLNPIDEAEGYQKRIKEHNYTHEELAEITNYTKDRIGRRLNLLKLHADIQRLVRFGNLDVTFAEKMVNLNYEGQRAALRVLEKSPNISVNSFERARNALLLAQEEQGQESLFNLADFWVEQVNLVKWEANGQNAQIDVPVLETAPEVVIKSRDKTGDVMHRYILLLADNEEYAQAAAVLGKLYKELVVSRKIQVPAPQPLKK